MAAPVIASKGTNGNANTNSVTPTYPASIAANDIIVCVMHKYTAATQPGAASITNNVGGNAWNLLFDSGTVRPVDGITVGSMAVWWKRASGGESGTETVSVASGATGASTSMMAQFYRITGCETSGNPFDGAVFKTAASGTGTTVTFDAVTVSAADRLLLGFYGAGDNIVCATPTGYSATIVADGTTTGSDTELQVFNKSPVSSDGAVTAASGLATGIPWGTVHVSFKPPAGGTTHTLQAVVTGTSSVTANVKVTRRLIAAVAGTSAVLGSLRVTRRLIAAVAGTSSVAAGLRVTRTLQAVVTGSSVVLGTLRVPKFLQAVVTGTSVVTVTLQSVKRIQASVVGTGAVTAVMPVTRRLQAVVTGSSVVVGAIKGITRIAAAVTGSSSVTAQVRIQKRLAASVSGSSSTTSQLRVTRRISAQVIGTSLVTGELSSSAVHVPCLVLIPQGQGALTLGVSEDGALVLIPSTDDALGVSPSTAGSLTLTPSADDTQTLPPSEVCE